MNLLHAKRFVVMIVVGFFCLCANMQSSAASEKKHVLILNSYHQSFRWTDDIVSSITSTFAEQPHLVEFHIEYMDKKRETRPAMESMYYNLLGTKYEDGNLDVIITSDDFAFNFLKKYHKKLFATAPVVFCGVNNVDAALSADRNYFTGVIEVLDIKDNIRLGQKLRPTVNNFVVVTDGTATGIGTRKMVQEAESHFPNIGFTYLNGEELSTDELLRRLGSLSANSMVIAPAWYLDKDGNAFDNTTIYPMISKSSAVPVISTSSANIGLGLIGGKVNSGIRQGKLAAEMAQRILFDKVKTKNIAILKKSHNPYVFDYRQLDRFQISEELLPQDSKVLYRPFSFYKTYRPLVIGVSVVFFVLVFLISYLWWNINRLRIARNKLSKSRENLRVTLQSIGDAVISVDTDGKITQMNRVAETITKWTESEAKGKSIEDVFVIVDTETRNVRRNPVSVILQTGESITHDGNVFLLSKNKQEHRISDSCSAIRNDRGEVLGVVLVFRDITEEYQKEIQMQQSRKMEAVGQLAGGVAHDFNNILAGIIASSEILSRQIKGNAKAEKFLNIIVHSSERAAKLILNLLTFARKQQLASSAVNVHEVILSTKELLKNTLDKRIDLVLDLKAEAETLMGDSSQLQNALINLCVNASHAMPQGGTISVHTQNRTMDESDNDGAYGKTAAGVYIEIEVTDTGSGISPENLERIFEPFFTTKEQGKGTGLGLTTVFNVVQQHNGHINVKSAVNQGTSFHVLLPLVETETQEEQASSDSISGNGHVLVIDDEEMMRETIKEMLLALGYTVDLAENGIEGLKLLKDAPHRYALVLLDMIMPKMSGQDCFFEMKKINPDVRVVVISGYSKEKELESMKEEGLCDILLKPFRISALSKVVFNAVAHTVDHSLPVVHSQPTSVVHSRPKSKG